MDSSTAALHLASALLVGLIVGLERGWRDRGLAEGERMAGLRTFALLGLLGGVLAVLQPMLGAGPLVAGLAGVAAVFALAFAVAFQASGSRSLTSIVAALLTLALGALAGLGQPALAIGCAVTTAVLLDLKPVLHGWLRLVAADELRAALQLGVLSAVIWPLLPDVGMGPYGALNPHQLWFAVVLVAGLSLAGHFAMRLAGARRGALLTGVLGGLASSTAVTVTLARRARQQSTASSTLAAGVMVACAVMFVRIGVLLAAMAPALLPSMAGPLAVMALAVSGVGAWSWRLGRHEEAAQADATGAETGDAEQADTHPQARYDLMSALLFAAMMAAVSVLTRALLDRWGDMGLYALAALSGLADVDAMTVSIARMHGLHSVAGPAATAALLILIASNLLSKAVMAGTLGGRALGWPVAVGFAVAIAAGAVTLAASG